MVRTTPPADLPEGLVERVLDEPDVNPQRLRAGRVRAAGEPIDALELATAVVAERQRG